MYDSVDAYAPKSMGTSWTGGLPDNVYTDERIRSARARRLVNRVVWIVSIRQTISVSGQSPQSREGDSREVTFRVLPPEQMAGGTRRGRSTPGNGPDE